MQKLPLGRALEKGLQVTLCACLRGFLQFFAVGFEREKRKILTLEAEGGQLTASASRWVDRQGDTAGAISRKELHRGPVHDHL